MQDPNDLVGLSRRMDSCGIQRLPAELIYTIFLKDTELDDREHNRLVTARYSSQVCRLWRAILLSTPSFWGQLFDLAYFDRTTDSWRQEILSRTGDAPLWVTGPIVQSALPFLQFIMENKWDKVRFVDLETLEELPNQTWSFMGKEAPSLEWFRIQDFSMQQEHIQVLPALFNGVAPRLRAFWPPSWFEFNMTTPCLSNVRDLTFFPGHTVPVIFSLLKSMPRITRLRIEGNRYVSIRPFHHTDLSKIDLPLLESLQIRGRHCLTVLSILEHIKPSSPCSLHVGFIKGLHSYDKSSENVGPPPSTIYDAVLKWHLPYTNKHPPKCVAMEAHQWYTDLVTQVNIWDFDVDFPTAEAPWDVEFILDTYGRPFVPALAPSFIAVERLHLWGVHRVQCDLHSLYSAFPSVTELTIHEALFEAEAFYTRDGDGEAVLFPLLHTVAVVGNHEGNLQSVADFLEYRIRIGFPVSILDISAVYKVHNDPEVMARLGKMKGLTIIWPTRRGQEDPRKSW